MYEMTIKLLIYIYFFCRCVDVAYRNIFFFCRCGDVTTLNVHALVHSTNEKLNDKSPETEKMYDKAGPELMDEIKKNVRSKRQIQKEY
jgi:hypothetical protein